VLIPPAGLDFYKPSINVTVPDFNIDGNSVGVSFTEQPLVLPEGLFNSRVDKFVEKGKVWEYEDDFVYDSTGAFKEMPGIWGAFGSGLGEGAANIKDGASDVVHFVVDPIHNNVSKPMARWMWRNTAMPLALDANGLASYFMDHSLQDHPSHLYFPASHAFSNIIKEHPEYLKLKDHVIEKAIPGESFQFTEDIAFKDGDLFYAIYRANVIFEGSLDKEGKIIELKSRLKDEYDFHLLTGYSEPHYGYGYLKYGKGYKKGYNGVMTLIANNVAWADMHLGVIVPYDIIIEIE